MPRNKSRPGPDPERYKRPYTRTYNTRTKAQASTHASTPNYRGPLFGAFTLGTMTGLVRIVYKMSTESRLGIFGASPIIRIAFVCVCVKIHFRFAQRWRLGKTLFKWWGCVFISKNHIIAYSHCEYYIWKILCLFVSPGKASRKIVFFFHCT